MYVEAGTVDLRDTFIVCALTGPWPTKEDYDVGPRYVKRLQVMCRAAIPGIPFYCITDRHELEIPGVTLRYAASFATGWWAKLQAFSPSMFPLGSRVLVVDLDTVVRRLDRVLAVDLATPVFLRSPYYPERAGSGLFSFRVGRSSARVWLDLCAAKKVGAQFHRADKPAPLGVRMDDEHWLADYIQPDHWTGWCDLLPGAVLNYKGDLNYSCEPLPEDCDIVSFDGQPRPHEVDAEWNPHYVRV